jgi:hypothetical protein
MVQSGRHFCWKTQQKEDGETITAHNSTQKTLSLFKKFSHHHHSHRGEQFCVFGVFLLHLPNIRRVGSHRSVLIFLSVLSVFLCKKIICRGQEWWRYKHKLFCIIFFAALYID